MVKTYLLGFYRNLNIDYLTHSLSDIGDIYKRFFAIFLGSCAFISDQI